MSFAGAHNFNIERATFGAQSGTDPIEILHRARAVEATHTSKTASYAPKCTLGTRVKIIEDMMAWVAAPTTSILWFSGPAGGGKTCIMRDLAANLQNAGVPVCTYFFSTKIAGLDTENPFIATIVHQLIGRFPALKPSVLQAVFENPTIFLESLDLQLETLVIKPLSLDLCRSSHQQVVIAVDGFDECRNPAERQHLLRLLRRLVARLPRQILIILASRPELDIRMAFSTSQFESITLAISLQDYDGKVDVRHYFCDEFERIRKTHPMRKSIPRGWPLEKILQVLIDKSSGHFIHPSTIIRYVDNPRRNPVELLALAMAVAPASPNDAHPLADLDALYTLILHPPHTNIDLVKRLLHCISHVTAIQTTSVTTSRFRRGLIYCSPPFLDNLLQLPSGTVDIALCDLHSVLSVPSPESGFDQSLSFHHKSLEDYLASPARSKDLFQSECQTHTDLALACVHHLQRWDNNPDSIRGESIRYARTWFGEHLRLSFRSRRPNADAVPTAILEFDPLIWWKCLFVSEGAIIPVHGASRACHQSICKEKHCVPLCKKLSRMHENEGQIQELSEEMEESTATERMGSFFKFTAPQKSEAGHSSRRGRMLARLNRFLRLK